MLKLITITSSRAEYDLLFPLLNSIRESKKITDSNVGLNTIYKLRTKLSLAVLI